MVVLTSTVMSALLLVVVSAMTYQGTFANGQSLHQLTYTVNTSAPYIHFQLYLTPFYSPGLLIGKNSNFTVSTNQQDWMHFDYLHHSDCDYQGMVTAKSQYGWISNTAPNLYLQLINFNPSTPFSYIINVTEGSSFLKSCQPSLPKMANLNYCEFCDPLHIGAFCEFSKHIVSASSEYYLTLEGESYNYFLFSSYKQIIISLTYENDVIVYLQTQQSINQLAGISNYWLDKQGLYKLTGNSSITISVNGNGRNILMGVINPHQNSQIFSIIFKEKQETDIIIIVVSVIGGLIVLGLIITGFIIFRKIANQQRSVYPQQPIFQRRNRKFSPQQIQIYFPSIQMVTICCSLQISFNNSKQNQQKNETQCVICLCSIQNQQMIRVGYCKHIFHANCLSQWFKKQQNCPYCRCNYSRQQTAQHYNKLAKKNGRNIRGQQITRSIFTRNLNSSLNTISIQTTKQTF